MAIMDVVKLSIDVENGIIHELKVENDSLRTALKALVNWYGRRDMSADDSLNPPEYQENEIAAAMYVLGMV